ncbi:hypothetical protein B0H14DRAFT_457268 [Mycena olivaceomarginata]|nr:hypothetical protein B0H14DRAFT_457268 [Mycena olivaceomarginata]
MLPVVYAMGSRMVRVAWAGRSSVWSSAQYARASQLLRASIRVTLRRDLAILSLHLKPRRPFAALITDSVLDVACRGRNILPAPNHPHPRYSPGSTSPSPSTLWPMTGRSSATADPLIERLLPGASPSLDPRPTAAPLRIQLAVRAHADLLAYIATPVEWLMLFNEPPGPAACRSST